MKFKQKNLREILDEGLNLEELRNICFDLDIDYEKLSNHKGGLVRELIKYRKKRGSLGSLLDRIIYLRPDLADKLKIFDQIRYRENLKWNFRQEGTEKMSSIFKIYSDEKQKVIQMFDEFQELMKVFDEFKELRNSNTYTIEAIGRLEKRINEIRESKYQVLIVGQVNAGKSTFINALLGEHILPTDSLQNTSTIITIVYDKKKYIEMVYANGEIDRIEGDQKIKALLNQFGAIREKYRNIPTTELNDYLINCKGAIDETEIEQKIKDGEWFNEANRPKQEFEKKVKAYLEEHKSLMIPVSITLAYPLADEFADISIVDTPGVNAVGGFQEVTNQIIGKANALIYVSSIDGIEEKSFNRFISQSTGKERDATFLVLTKAGTISSEKIREHLAQAHELYLGKEFPKERITYVDSLLKILQNLLNQHDSVSSLLQYIRNRLGELKQQGLSAKSEHGVLTELRSLLRRLQDELEDQDLDVDSKAVINDYAKVRANFDSVKKMLVDFLSDRPFKELEWMVREMRTVYKQKEKDISDLIDLLEEKQKKPEEFSKRVAESQKQLTEYETELSQFSKSILTQYTSKDAPWKEEMEEIGQELQKKIKGKKLKRPSHVKSAVRKTSAEINELSRELMEEIYALFYDKMGTVGLSFSIRQTIEMPQIELKLILRKSKIKAEETVYDTVGIEVESPGPLGLGIAGKWGFTETRYVEVSRTKRNKKEFTRQIRKRLGPEFEDYLEEVESTTDDAIRQYCLAFESQLKGIISDRKCDLEELQKAEKENEETIAQILTLKKIYTQIEKKLSDLNFQVVSTA